MPADLRPVVHSTLKPQPVRDAFSRANESIDSWLNEKHAPAWSIPAGTDKYGDARIRSGIADPEARIRFQESEDQPRPTSTMKRLSGFVTSGLGLSQMRDALTGRDPKVPDEAASFSSPVMTAAEMVNDLNTRIGSLRQWRADDPTTDKDNPEFEYTLPSGEVYKTSEQEPYWTVGNSKLNARQIKELEPVSGGYRLPSGEVVPATALEKPAFSHYAFPDGTITATADGSIPEAMKDVPKRQANTRKMSFLGHDTPLPWGPAQARAPWQNSADENIWEKEYWDRVHSPEDFFRYSTLNEAPAWFADLNLGSVPYYIPGYNIVAGASAALPYLNGYAGDTYMPTGRDFHNLDELGKGTYKDTELTNAQRIGGVMAPIIDAVAERASGSAIGGIEKHLPESLKNSAVGRFLNDTILGRMTSSAATEGLEEVASSPFQQLQQEGWKDYGRERTVNDVTGEYEFDQSTPRFGTMRRTMGQDFLAGATLGGVMAGFGEGATAVKNRRTGGPAPQIAPAPRRTEAELRELQRLYRQRED